MRRPLLDERRMDPRASVRIAARACRRRYREAVEPLTLPMRDAPSRSYRAGGSDIYRCALDVSARVRAHGEAPERYRFVPLAIPRSVAAGDIGKPPGCPSDILSAYLFSLNTLPRSSHIVMR